MTDKKQGPAFQQFSNITSALMGPIMMFGLIGYAVTHYTGFRFGTEIGVVLGSILGMGLLIREVSKL